MAQTSWPFENIDTSETQYSALFSQFQETGVAGASDQTSTLEVTTTTGLGLSLAAGFAIIRGFAYENTTPVALTVDAASPQNRIDTVILRLDPIANSITALVKKGTPDASPSAPALTQVAGGVWEMALYNVSITTGTTALGPANLTDRRQFLGGRVGYWTTGARPTNPRTSQLGYNYTLGKFEYWTGTAWDTTLPIDITIANGSITDAMLAVPGGRYKQTTVNASTSISVGPSDLGRLIYTSAATAVTITIQSGMVSGDRIDIFQNGAGQITFAAGAGVNLASRGARLKTAGQYAGATVLCLGGNEYRLIGDLVA